MNQINRRPPRREKQSSTPVKTIKTIAVLNPKIGCGKTTISLNLAAAIWESGCRAMVLAVQSSATQWAGQVRATYGPGFQLRNHVRLWQIDGAAVRLKAPPESADDDAEVVILDTPELQEAALVSALLADLVLVPATPGPLDFWAAIAIARRAREERHGLPLISLVPSKVIAGAVLSRELVEELEAAGEVVAPGIAQCGALVEAAVARQTIATYAPHSPSHHEFLELAKHSLRRLAEGWAGDEARRARALPPGELGPAARAALARVAAWRRRRQLDSDE